MNQLNTVFLGIIAAVLVGAAGVWWSQQPSAAERRAAESQERIDTLRQAVDDYKASADRVRAIDN